MNDGQKDYEVEREWMLVQALRAFDVQSTHDRTKVSANQDHVLPTLDMVSVNLCYGACRGQSSLAAAPSGVMPVG